MHPSSYVEFRMAISPYLVIRSTSCFVLGGVFIVVGGLNGTISCLSNPRWWLSPTFAACTLRVDENLQRHRADFPATARLSCLTCFGFKRQLCDALALRAFSFILSAAATKYRRQCNTALISVHTGTSSIHIAVFTAER